MGMCSNAGAVLWYLGFSRHEHMECPYDVQNLGDSLQDEATIDDPTLITAFARIDSSWRSSNGFIIYMKMLYKVNTSINNLF